MLSEPNCNELKGEILMANILNILDKSPLENKIINVCKNKIKINTYLSVDDYASCIYTVVNSCFDKSGQYKPEFKEIAKRWAYIKYFTDIELGDMKIEELFKCSQANWWREVYNEILNIPVYYDIESTINEMIEYRINTRMTKFDQFCSDLSEVLKIDNTQDVEDIKEVLDGLNKVDKQEFVKAVTENVIEKTKAGDNNGGEKSEGATD